MNISVYPSYLPKQQRSIDLVMWGRRQLQQSAHGLTLKCAHALHKTDYLAFHPRGILASTQKHTLKNYLESYKNPLQDNR